MITITDADATTRQLLRECLAQLRTHGAQLMALKDTADHIAADVVTIRTVMTQLQAIIADLKANAADPAAVASLDASDAALRQIVVDNMPA